MFERRLTAKKLLNFRVQRLEVALGHRDPGLQLRSDQSVLGKRRLDPTLLMMGSDAR
ncbi:hypothetical protein AB9K34_05605 [Sedimentitalea sp. XS_ASV28]|uniref:hypothetical protein n=1 Tax=Sedimentitalea sp. XS_ASV28 TaxID=3241296 RepID=UPI003511CF99